MKTTEDRFWEKVHKTETCWLWTGSLRSKGYGAFVYSCDGITVHGRAHRFSWELHRGDIPDGMFVLHRCDTPACVNPDHLFLGTNDDNIRDMLAKGRHVPGGTYSRDGYKRGEGHHAARLTPEIVRAIREEHATGEYSFSELACRFGLALGHTHRIITRKAWSHVE